MNTQIDIKLPQQLPFLQAICYDLRDVTVLTMDEILNRYERGWKYKGTLADLGTEERDFLAKLVRHKKSWLPVDV